MRALLGLWVACVVGCSGGSFGAAAAGGTAGTDSSPGGAGAENGGAVSGSGGSSGSVGSGGASGGSAGELSSGGAGGETVATGGASGVDCSNPAPLAGCADPMPVQYLHVVVIPANSCLTLQASGAIELDFWCAGSGALPMTVAWSNCARSGSFTVTTLDQRPLLQADAACPVLLSLLGTDAPIGLSWSVAN
jgi:hypothetical protein